MRNNAQLYESISMFSRTLSKHVLWFSIHEILDFSYLFLFLFYGKVGMKTTFCYEENWISKCTSFLDFTNAKLDGETKVWWKTCSWAYISGFSVKKNFVIY